MEFDEREVKILQMTKYKDTKGGRDTDNRHTPIHSTSKKL